MEQCKIDKIEFNGYRILKCYDEITNPYITIIDKDGYLYYLRVSIILNCIRRNNIMARFLHGNIYTPLNIKTFLKINKLNFILKSPVVEGARTNIIWECTIHGEFSTSWNCIKSGIGCPKCGTMSTSNKRKKDFEYVKSKFKEKGLTVVSTEYKNNETPLSYICDKHPELGIQTARYGNIQKKNARMCATCSADQSKASMTKTHAEFLVEMNSVHGNKYTVLGTYLGAKHKIKIKCNVCSQEWNSAPNHLTGGHGCPNCNESLGESKIKLWLLQHNVDFDPQYRFSDCIGIRRKMPFDFVLWKDAKVKSCIEYQGQQHYFPIEMFGGAKAYEIQLINDDIKRNYCKDQNLELYEIPYWEYENINIILAEIMEKTYG